ncbi:unnamed protein product [Discula destructiva]
MSTGSLQALVDISRHETLGPLLTHLIIGLDHLTTITATESMDFEDLSRFDQACDNQQYLLDSGHALDCLTEALSNLRNLSTVDLRDFNSPTRYRDTPSSQSELNKVALFPREASWTSYGYSEAPEWAHHVTRGNGILTGRESSDFICRVFKVVMISLGRSNNKVRSLEVLCKGMRGISTGLADAAFSLFPNPDCTKTTLVPVLAGLTKLHLDIGFNSNLQDYEQHFLDWSKPLNLAHESWDPTTRHLRRFLSLVPNVTWLRLNFSNNRQTAVSELLIWLAQDPDKQLVWSDTYPKSISPPLRRLDLGNVSVTSKTLLQILKKFDRLEAFSLRRMRLRNVSHGQGFGDHGENDKDDSKEGRKSTWARIFRLLPVLTPNLKHLHLADLREHIMGKSGTEPIVFSSAAIENATARQSHDFELDLTTGDALSFEDLADRTWRLEAWYLARRKAQREEGDAKRDIYRGEAVNENDDHPTAGNEVGEEDEQFESGEGEVDEDETGE